MRDAEIAAAKSIILVEAKVGEPLKNISILENNADPIALNSSEYPNWLKIEVEYDNKNENLEKSSRKALRIINKADIRRSNEERSA